MDREKDIRIQKTNEAINLAFRQLLMEKRFDEITVAELTKRARISRRTFYLRYQSLNQLLKENQEKIIDNFVMHIEKLCLPEDLSEVIECFFHYAMELEEVDRRILSSGQRQELDQIIENRIQQIEWHEDGDDSDTSNQEYKNFLKKTFIFYGLIEIYQQWEKDNQTLTRDRIVKLTKTLMLKGVKAVR